MIPLPSISFWQAAQRRLFAPHPSITDVGQRRQAELAAWVSLVLAVWFSLAVITIVWAGAFSVSTLPLLLVAVASLGAYILSRTRYLPIACWLITLQGLTAGYSLLPIIPLTDASPSFLALVVIGLVIGSALLSVKALAGLVVGNTLAWMAALTLIQSTARPDFYAPAASTTIIGILLSIFSGVRNRIERDRLRQITAVNEELRAMQATLESRVENRTQALDRARREAEAAQQALEQEVWLTSRQIQVSNALRTPEDLTSLANRAAQAICAALEAPVAAIYIWRGNCLVYAGSCAFAPDDRAEWEVIRPGEGLLGQAALEEQPILTGEVPPGYFDILSGLGATTPRQLALWPLSHAGQQAGVIEIGLMTPLTSQQEQFLSRAAETLAASLQAITARARINELLAETQTQAEELQNREQELRAINEELEAQAEAWKTSGAPRGANSL
jgi:Skp family chaperone for outer membrane proteins